MKKSKLPANGSFIEFVQQQHPGTPDPLLLPSEEINTLRKDYVEELLKEEVGELSEVERIVAKSAGRKKFISPAQQAKNETASSFGERVSDNVAAFGGSWRFIILFFTVLLAWMLLNAWLLHDKGFDPYPFILLNLILSCIAAIQAPIIMMSQNRQEAKDRQRAENDYKVNLKSEIEIRLLHEKLDHVLLHQNKRLLEIQKVQMDMLDNISQLIQSTKK